MLKRGNSEKMRKFASEKTMAATAKCFLLHDSQLGDVRFVPNMRATRFTFRVKEGQLVCSCPYGIEKAQVVRAFEELRPRLIKMMERDLRRKPSREIKPGFRIDTEDFVFSLQESRVSRLLLRQRRGELVCHYPSGQDFAPQYVQDWLVEGIENSLREHAKVLFTPRLRAFAQERGLTYNKMYIHKTRGRWGSCSSQRNINLSLYLMLLPRHLQDFVMQHELTHLLEMNHGPRFHALLDDAVHGLRKAYEKELKKYDTDIFFFGHIEERKEEV